MHACMGIRAEMQGRDEGSTMVLGVVGAGAQHLKGQEEYSPRQKVRSVPLGVELVVPTVVANKVLLAQSTQNKPERARPVCPEAHMDCVK